MSEVSSLSGSQAKEESGEASSSSSDMEMTTVAAVESQDKKLSPAMAAVKKWMWVPFYAGLLAYTIAVIVIQIQEGNDFKGYAGWIFVAVAAILHKVYDLFRDPISTAFHQLNEKIPRPSKKVRAITSYVAAGLYAAALLIAGVVTNIILPEEGNKTPGTLYALGGLLFMLIVCFLLSPKKKNIRLRPIVSLGFIHLATALIVGQTEVGRGVVQWLSDLVGLFLGFVVNGQAFILGADVLPTNGSWTPADPSLEASAAQTLVWAVKNSTAADAAAFNTQTAWSIHYFAAIVAPTVIYFSAVTSMVFYLGILQPVCIGIGALLNGICGISIITSLTAVVNIFLGMTEAPMVIRKFLPTASASDLHAVMAAGFATVSGSVMGGYIAIGIPAGNILTASVMNAPIAVALALIVLPAEEEDDNEMTSGEKMVIIRETMYEQTSANVVDAIGYGTSSAIMLALNILAMVSVFISLLGLCSHALNWLCWLVGVQGPLDANDVPQKITVELVTGYVLCPLVFLMGVPWEDCVKMAKVIAVKIIANEFVAFAQLKDFYQAQVLCDTISSNTYNDNFEVCSQMQEVLVYSVSSLSACAFACCGFANFGSVGITLGGLALLLPESRRYLLPKHVGTALIVGIFASMFSGCVMVLVQNPESTFLL